MGLNFRIDRANRVLNPVRASVNTFGDDVNAKCRELTDPHVPEGMSNTDYRATMDIHLATSDGARVVVRKKAKAYNRTKATKNDLGRQYRATVTDATKATRDLRRDLEDNCQGNILFAIDMVRLFDPKQDDAVEEIEHCLSLLKGLDMSLYPPKEGKGFDIDARVTFIEKLLAEAATLKEQYDLAVKKNNKAFSALEEAYDDFRRIFVNSTRVIESFFRMAGFDKEADRLRYLVKKAKNNKAPDDEKSGDTPPEDDGAQDDGRTQDGEDDGSEDDGGEDDVPPPPPDAPPATEPAPASGGGG